MPTLGLVAVLVLVTRPLVAFFATIRTELTRGERAFTGWMAPRGIVAAATATTFGAELAAHHIGGASKILPVAFLVITAALKGFDRNLERAAMSAGAGPLRTFLWVTMPVLRPGILIGALFAFLHSFNEAVVAIFIAGRDASTLPKKMFESIRLESDPVIAVVSTLLTGAVLLGVLLSLFVRKRPASR